MTNETDEALVDFDTAITKAKELFGTKLTDREMEAFRLGISLVTQAASSIRTDQDRITREEIAEYIANTTTDLCENSQAFKNDLITHLTSKHNNV